MSATFGRTALVEPAKDSGIDGVAQFRHELWISKLSTFKGDCVSR